MKRTLGRLYHVIVVACRLPAFLRLANTVSSILHSWDSPRISPAFPTGSLVWTAQPSNATVHEQISEGAGIYVEAPGA